MIVITSADARRRFADLLDTVDRGEEVMITRHGRPVAMLVGAAAPRSDRDERTELDIAAPLLAREEAGEFVAGRRGIPAASGPSGADRLFAGRAIRDVVSLFVLRPDQEFYQREVARLARVSLRSAQLALDKLVGLRLVQQRSSGNRKYYSALPSATFDSLRAWAIPEVAVVPVLRSSLTELGASVQMALVYGSTASGDDTATSDVDLMLVGEVDADRMYEAVRNAEDRLGRDINVTYYDPDEFFDKIASGAHFITAVLRGPILWVIGQEWMAAHVPH